MLYPGIGKLPKCHFLEAYDVLLFLYLLQACGLTEKRDESIFGGERLAEI